MARIRSVKPELLTSEKVAGWPIAARYFFVALFMDADDYGRGTAINARLRSHLLPYDEDISVADVAGWMDLYERDNVVRRYTVEGRRYYFVVNWDEHQHPRRRMESKIPAPSQALQDEAGDQGVHQMSGTVPTNVRHIPDIVRPGDVDVDVDVDVETPPPSEGPPSPPPAAASSSRTRGTRIATDFDLDDEMRRYAIDKAPLVNVDQMLEDFRDYWQAKAGQAAVKTDWRAAWRSWVRRQQTYAEERQPTPRRGAIVINGSDTPASVDRKVEAGMRTIAELQRRQAARDLA